MRYVGDMFFCWYVFIMSIYYIYAFLRIIKKKKKKRLKKILMRWICGAFEFTLDASLASSLRICFRVSGFAFDHFRVEDQEIWNEEDGV